MMTFKKYFKKNIELLRVGAERRVKDGAVNYRSTLLGGCTKACRYDSFLLGCFTECFSCEGRPSNQRSWILLEGEIDEIFVRKTISIFEV